MEFENLDDDIKRFGIVDYLIFVGMLVISGLIGVYFGFLRKSAESTAEYLVGGRNMSVLPVAVSLIASWISGISLLGVPTDVYLYGMHYAYFALGAYIMAVILSKNYLPVFHNLKLTSTYEYLEKRFNNQVRLLGSVLFIVINVAWLPIVIYVPALVFSQVSGVNLHFVSPVVCIVCIFYTSVGGLKAVVWTDVVQAVIMYGSIFLIVVKGTLDVGGISAVWQANYNSSRIELPNFAFDLTTRYTFWSLVFGGSFHWLTTNAVHQIMMQRYLCLPSVNDAKKALVIYIFGLSFLISVCCYNGLLVYTRYQHCDPLTTKAAKAKDQLLPLLVMDILGDYPGCPGLFVAAIFSAALSSLSSGLNSVAAVVREDFCKILFKRPLSEHQSYIIMKSVVIAVGALCVGLVFVVEKLGSVIQLTFTLESIGEGPLLGMFSAGIFFSRISSQDVLVGGTAGLAFMSWLAFGTQSVIASGDLTYETKAVSVEGCHNFTQEGGNTTSSSNSEVFGLYRLSYMWYSMVGCMVTVLVSLIMSYFTEIVPVDEELLSPMVRQLRKKKILESDKKSVCNYTVVELDTLKEPLKNGKADSEE